jgi:hypothetical protein
MNSLPVLFCAHHRFGGLAADPLAAPWTLIPKTVLSDNQTGRPPQQATSLRLGHDEHALRLLFECEDSEPWATLTGHDEPLYKEEVVEVFLDPVGDGEAYFELELNVNNAVLDGCMRRVRSGYRKDFRWHCAGLQTAVRVIPGGWIAEWAIPFESISGHAHRVEDCWRANFTRIDRPSSKPRELSAWSPTGLPQFHVPQKFGTLKFCRALAV